MWRQELRAIQVTSNRVSAHTHACSLCDLTRTEKIHGKKEEKSIDVTVEPYTEGFRCYRPFQIPCQLLPGSALVVEVSTTLNKMKCEWN